METPTRFIFGPALLPQTAFDYRDHMARFPELSKAEAKAAVKHMSRQKVYLSSLYQVNAEEVETSLGTVTWLSIKRVDKAAFHDWRELQGIKNAICGPEREGCELYPAESRLVDTSNQYHLWVLPAGMAFPFGYANREVRTESSGGAVQRKFNEGEEPREST
jgi:hypothetical protein